MSLLSDIIKVSLNPKKFSEVEDNKMGFGTVVAYIVLATIAVSIATGLSYYDGLYLRAPAFTELLIIIVFSIIFYFIAIKTTTFVTKKESKEVTENKVTRVLIMAVVFASLISPILTAITIQAFWVDDVIGYLLVGLDILAVLYSLYLIYAGFRNFIKTDHTTALTGATWFAALSMLTGFIIRTTIFTIVYGI